MGLDTSDMEKHSVELRVLLDRHRRRFNTAQRPHAFEEIVMATLNKNRQQQANQDNYIHLQTVDPEGLKMLARFLDQLIAHCQRLEQHEQFQQTLRAALQSSRRQSILAQQQQGDCARPLEPFCLFCASDLHATTCHHGLPDHQAHYQGLAAGQTGAHGAAGARGPLAPATHLDGQQQFVPSIQLVPESVTPPPSAAPTPDVGFGHQHTYTPNLHQQAGDGCHTRSARLTTNASAQSHSANANADTHNDHRAGPPGSPAGEQQDDMDLDYIAPDSVKARLEQFDDDMAHPGQVGRSSTPLSDAPIAASGLVIDDTRANVSQPSPIGASVSYAELAAAASTPPNTRKPAGRHAKSIDQVSAKLQAAAIIKKAGHHHHHQQAQSQPAAQQQAATRAQGSLSQTPGLVKKRTKKKLRPN